MKSRRFDQVDVFTAEALLGNPLAVVHGADGLDEARMADFARWMNLSETAFLLQPTDPAADYRVRIFTPGGELPFAGHPTLGSCHAWLAAGGVPRQPGRVVQQCGIGLVPLRDVGARWWFAAPPCRREPVEPALLAAVCAALGLPLAEVCDSAWLDNGPNWLCLRIDDVAHLHALRPDHAALRGLAKVGVVAPQLPGEDTQFEVRAFAAPVGVDEDPVTGSLNAGLAGWLMETGHAPARYVAAQGKALGRAGRVFVLRDESGLWVGGDVTALIEGQVQL
jgi:PhzF family phenazine biosynthesis protein